MQDKKRRITKKTKKKTTISEMLRTWRANQRMTVREAAKKMDLHYSTFSSVENGHPLDGKTLAKILIFWLKDK